MGLFDKLGAGKKSKKDDQSIDEQKQQKQSKKEKSKKGGKEKKGRFGGKKKEVTLLERMQLDESVADSAVSVLQELVEVGDSAVREVDEGIMIVAFTNQMLEDSENLDPKGEDFGSFAEALRSESIESIALQGDLENGVVGIIPSSETLRALDEFEFVHDLEFHWALVPFDITDEDQLTIFDTTVPISRLVQMANDQSIGLSIVNGEVVEAEGSGNQQQGYDDGLDYEEEEDDLVDDSDDEVAFEDDSDDELEFDDEPVVQNDDSFDDFDDFDDEDEIETDDEFDADDSFDDDSFDDGDELDVDDSFGDDDFEIDQEEETYSPEESKEAITKAAYHTFNNTELDLQVDMTRFDNFFDSIQFATFDVPKSVGDNQLQAVLAKMKENANVEIQRFHQNSIQGLRNEYLSNMTDVHTKLVDVLDHKNPSKKYGERANKIESEYDQAMDDIDRLIANEVSKITQEYNADREEYAENAKREAYAIYDSNHRDAKNRRIEIVKDQVRADVKTTRDTQLGELYQDRRNVAQRLFDKAEAALTRSLQEKYQAIAQKELEMYDKFRKNMDLFLRTHFSDEVLRSKAQAEQLRQAHEADRVRQEYDQILLTKTREAEEADKLARNRLAQLEKTLKEDIDQVKADYTRLLDREKSENEELRRLLSESNKANMTIGEQKDKEVAHSMKILEDQVKATQRELEYANQRANSAQKPVKFIIGAVAAITLALGIIAGFLFGANTTQIAPSQPASTQTQNNSTSYHYDVDGTKNVHDFEQSKSA